MELLRVFSAAFLCALACYLILTARTHPRLDSPVRKVCWHCYELHDEHGEWCPACKSALFPDGATCLVTEDNEYKAGDFAYMRHPRNYKIKTRVAIRRMRPTSTGWRLIQDAE